MDSRAEPVRAGVLIGVAVGLVGVTFGVLARAADLSVAQACVMSLLVFTGASQFAVVGVISSGGSALAAFGAAVLLAARNTLYGPVVGNAVRGPLWSRLAQSQLVIDESAGLAAAQPDARSARRGFLAAGVGVYVCWNLGTLLGALGGDVLGDTDRWGLDAAFPACFLALLAPHVRTRPGRAAAVLAAAIAVAATPLVPVGVPILLACLAIVPAGVLRARREPLEREDER